MMGEMAGGLIEMNATMVTTGAGLAMILIGAVATALFGVLALGAWLFTEKRRWLTVGLTVMLTLAGIGLVIAGSSRPKVKQIRCCASGPVSLDLVAARYDIVSVDGQELVLRER